MRLFFFLVLFCVSAVQGKGHVKTLTESMGQEIIEIGTRIKAELPPGLEEEPSAEFDDDDANTSIQPITKRETKKATTTAITSIKTEDEKNALSSEEEEIKVEKELADIYKDTDYKAEAMSTEVLSSSSASSSVVIEDKPIARSKNNFKFQPDLNNRADVERFRTSIDEISCDRRVTQKLGSDVSGTAYHVGTSLIAIGSALLTGFIIQ